MITAAPSFADDRPAFITISSGVPIGAQYPLGGAICNAVDAQRKNTGLISNLRCDVQASTGSVSNLLALSQGSVELATSPTYLQHSAYSGTGVFNVAGVDGDLRTVLLTHQESFFILATEGSSIESVYDLLGKKINFGSDDSTEYAATELVFRSLGWSLTDVERVDTVRASKAGLLCDGQLDAIVVMEAHPSAVIKQAVGSCNVKFVSLSASLLERITASSRHLGIASIPGGMYRGNEFVAPTFAMSSALVSSSKVDDQVVYDLVKSVFENMDEITQDYPALANLREQAMLSDNATVPLHAGARRYFLERDLLN